jgi:twitching motility protein PilT
MIRRNGSDIHLKVGRPPTLRVDGELIALEHAPLRPEDLKNLAEQLMTPRQVNLFSEEKECDFEIGVRARLPREPLPAARLVVLRDARHSVSGAHGASNPRRCQEIAINRAASCSAIGDGGEVDDAGGDDPAHQPESPFERSRSDPIEFLHRDINCNINQREVGTDTGSFAQALRRVMRQDPDIILIGEIRDRDTLEIALQAADTGHLVLATLHTSDATQTINRVMSFYPPHEQSDVRFMLSTALQAIVSLRLAPRADRSGRIPACEVLINTAAVRDNIRDLTKTLNIPELIRDGTVQYGMQSFDQSLMNWYSKGIISYESALFYATNPSEFALKVQGVAGASDTSWDNLKQDVAK